MTTAVHQFAIVFLSLILGSHAVLAQGGQAPGFPWEGEVAGSNVYVRSGAGANWYPTAKLNSGDRVLVLGEKYGWYQITPPNGSFSYVDMATVDRMKGAKTGTIKSDKVYIRAGSQMEQRKNATQLVLNKGATVDILGEAEGFYKIAPPSGATLYISKQYVKPIGASLASGMVQRHLSATPPPQSKSTLEKNPASDAPVEQVVKTPAEAGSALPPPGSEPIIPTASVSSANSAEPSLEPEPAPMTRGAATDSIIIPGPKNDPAAGTSPQPPLVPKPIVDASSPSVEPALGRTDQDDSSAMPQRAGEPIRIAANQLSRPVLPGTTAEQADSIQSAPAAKVEPAQNRYQLMLATCESELVSLINKPLDKQDPTDLLRKYEEIASQSGEFVPAEVAKIRVRQLRERMELHQSHLALHTDEKDLATYRANMDNERMAIMRRRVHQALDTFDIEGELRRSLAFASEDRRYRLVDPDTGSTLAYVDIPRAVDENPDHLIGRQVGIKVAGKTFSPSARVPIAVARQVVDVSNRQSSSPIEDISLPPLPPPKQVDVPEESPAPATVVPLQPRPPGEAAEPYEKMQPIEPGIHLAPNATDPAKPSTVPTGRAVSSADRLDQD